MQKIKQNISILFRQRKNSRPQNDFKTPVDNKEDTPFIPRLKSKPHSSTSSYRGIDDEHPYQIELDNFKPPQVQLARGAASQSPILISTPLVFVDTESRLKKLLKDLSRVSEIAVDVEHHSYRSYQGITCLLQISTRQKDYIIDTLALRDDLQILNEVFTNPRVLKVFHDGRWDILWLQRDLSIYVVNMFDTYRAAKQLSFDKLSLAHLLKHYCNVDADKTSATEDWRKRPLPDKMIAYARQDTHNLLYIYDRLRQDLIDQANGHTNLLLNVYQRSIEVCKRRYIKMRKQPDAHLKLYQKSDEYSFGYRQLFVLRALYAWRDTVARQEDESCGYVLPNRILMEIADRMPRKKREIAELCDPMTPLVRDHLSELHQVVLKSSDEWLIVVS